ncbi:hypothetical protein EMCRGX_G033937 [Ephydatia muelleri]
MVDDQSPVWVRDQQGMESKSCKDAKLNFKGSFSIQYAIAVALVSAIYYSGYYHVSIVPLPTSIDLVAKLSYTIRCAFPMVLVLFFFIMNVGNKRFVTAAIDPLGGNEHIVQLEKNVLTNTLEQFVLSFTLMLVAATYLDTVEKMKIIALYSFAFVIGRVLFRIGCFAPDGFDAVSVQNVGSTYIIVSWDLPTHSNGILINFTTTPPASSSSLCTCTCPPVTPTGTALQLERGVGRHQCCSQPAQHEEDSPPGGPPDPTNDIVISLFINKIINLTSPLAPPLGAYCPQTFMTPTSTVVYVGLGA